MLSVWIRIKQAEFRITTFVSNPRALLVHFTRTLSPGLPKEAYQVGILNHNPKKLGSERSSDDRSLSSKTSRIKDKDYS